mgnify:FL=1
MNLLREYIRVLLEQDQGSKGSLVVVDIQPEYESNTPFDIGDMLRTAAEDYSRVLFLFNGEDTLGMVSESALKNFYFEKLDYDEEVFDELLSKSEFFDKGYGFFRDVMDSSVCFDRTSIVKIVKYMIDKDIHDIRDLEEEDVDAIGVSELLFDDLEDYGFYLPELEEVLPRWSGSDLAGGARNECMAEVEILGAAQGLSFNHVDQFIYEGDNRYTEALTEAAAFKHKGSSNYFRVDLPGIGYAEGGSQLRFPDCQSDVDALMKTPEYLDAEEKYVANAKPRTDIVRNEETGKYEEVEVGPAKFRPRFYDINNAWITNPENRGKGYGKEIYKAFIDKAVEYSRSYGGVFIGAHHCTIGSGTSDDAKRVWNSLSREYNSSGDVIFIGI